MYREVVKRKGNTVLTVIGLVVFVFIGMSILDSIPITRYRLVVDIFAICFFAYIVYLVIKYKVADFRYVLIDTDLIFQKILGRYETVALNVNVADILMIAPKDSSDLEQYDKIEKTYNLPGLLIGKNKYCGIFKKDNKYYRFVFLPSDKLIDLLKRSIPKKVLD